jgi:hypothetical protein
MFNFANIQHFAVSVFGALVVSTMLVSAAVGPVAQFV